MLCVTYRCQPHPCYRLLAGEGGAHAQLGRREKGDEHLERPSLNFSKSYREVRLSPGD